MRRWFLLAVFLLAGLGGRAEISNPADPLAGDDRLRVRRTLRVRDTPLRDFLADLNGQTGIRFFTDPAVADDKLTLIAHDRPTADTLRAVAALFGFSWKRAGKPGDYAYTLYEPEETRRAEETAITKAALAAAERIREEADAFARLQTWTTEEADTRADEIARKLEEETDPTRRRALAIEQAVCTRFLPRREWRLTLKLLDGMKTAEIADLMRGEETEYAWPPVPGSRPLPAGLAAELRPVTRPGGPSAREETTLLRGVCLRFSAGPGSEPRLRWRLISTRRRFQVYSFPIYQGVLPAVELSARSPAAPDPPDWRADPALAAPVRYRLAGSRPEITTGNRQAPESRRDMAFTLGEALEALDRARPTDLLADSYWPARLHGADLEETTIGEALSHLSRATGHRWWKENGFVMIRSLSCANDRRAEPPATAVARWRERDRAGTMDLEDCAEAVALPDPAFATLIEMAALGAAPSTLAQTEAVRCPLRLWQSMPRAQRREAEGEGVAFGTLTSDQQALFRRGLADLLADARSVSALPQIGDGWRFRVEVTENRLWSVRSKSNAPSPAAGAIVPFIALPSRAEALRHFRQFDPSLRSNDLREGLRPVIRFLYVMAEGRPPLVQALPLPPRWLD